MSTQLEQGKAQIKSPFNLTPTAPTGLIRDLDGSIAQSVEQGIENPCVPGSIPGRATTKFKSPSIF